MLKNWAKTMVAGALALSIGLVGCSSGESKSAPAQDTTAQETTTTQGTTAQDTSANQQTTDATTAQNQPQTQTQNQNATDAAATQTTDSTGTQTQSTQAAGITEDDAKQTALNDAGVAEQDTTGLSVHRETDDGVDKYEVHFMVGTVEYDYDIDANTGAILERSSENEAYDD